MLDPISTSRYVENVKLYRAASSQNDDFGNWVLNFDPAVSVQAVSEPVSRDSDVLTMERYGGILTGSRCFFVSAQTDVSSMRRGAGPDELEWSGARYRVIGVEVWSNHKKVFGEMLAD